MATEKISIKLGPWSGTGGDAWDYNPGVDSSISEVVVGHGEVIDSISFKSINHKTGDVITSGVYGGSGGTITEFEFKGDEYLTSISGTVIDYLGTGSSVVETLRFHTNKDRIMQVSDNVSGTPFEIPIEDGEIVGFFGRAGSFIDAIGVRVKPRADSE